MIQRNADTISLITSLNLKDDSITNKKTTEATGSSPFVVTINKENTKNVNIKAIQDNITKMDTITNEHNRNIIDNNTIEKDTENEYRRHWNYETQRHNEYSNDQCQDNEHRYNRATGSNQISLYRQRRIGQQYTQPKQHHEQGFSDGRY
ncbi:unnamed protein product [Rhizophagus irregularis]|nr:unnamed protein product [Rhizophagus irregularis]